MRTHKEPIAKRSRSTASPSTRQAKHILATHREACAYRVSGTAHGDRPLTRHNASDQASECLQHAEVQLRGRNASCRCPLTHCEGRVPKAEGPGQDRDEVLNPAMDRRQTTSSYRNMGGCCVVEDTDQNVDRDEQSSCAEKGLQKFHLNSPPVWTLEVVRMSDRLAGTGRGTCGGCHARHQDKAPVQDIPRAAPAPAAVPTHWVEPRLIGEVAFTDPRPG
jgi:hypothetical protein